MSQKITEKKQKAAELVAQMRKIQDLAEKENRAFTADENTSYAKLEKDFDTIKAEITRLERFEQADDAVRAMRDQRDERRGGGNRAPSNRANASQEYHDAFFGAGGFLRSLGSLARMNAAISNVLTTSVDGDGGFLVPEEFEREIIRLLYNADPMRAAATVISTASDRNIPVQISGIVAAWLGETGTFPQVKPGVGRVVLGAHKLGCVVPVSEELLQDSGSDIQGFIRDVGVQAMADLQNAAFTNGDGANKPLGIFATDKVAGVDVPETVGAVSVTPVITGDNLIDVFHGLGRQYRARARWLTSDAIVKMIRKLKSTDNQYLWQPGLTAGQPDTILGRPVDVSDFAPTPAVSTRSIAFGDFKKYMIADRLGLGVRRLDELGALDGQVYFRMVQRVDGRLADAKAVNFFKHGAAA